MRVFTILMLSLAFLCGYAQGHAGNAIHIEGVASEVSIDHEAIGNPSGSFTVSMWVKFLEYPTGGWKHFLAIKGGGTNWNLGFWVGYDAQDISEELYACVGDNHMWYPIFGRPISLHVWIHIAVVYDYDAGTFSFYRDGEKEGWANVPPVVWDNSPLIIGKGDLNVLIDEFRFWNIVRAPGQICHCMHDILTPDYYMGPDSGLIAYWRFDETAGNKVYDMCSGVPGTILKANLVSSDAPLHIIDTPAMSQNLILEVHPNPVRQKAFITLERKDDAEVCISLLDLMGHELEALIPVESSDGEIRAVWNSTGYPAGIYLVRVICGNQYTLAKVVVVRGW